MTIEVLNESGHELDVHQLATLSRFVMDQLRVHPQAELCIKAVDEATIAELNERWMAKQAPPTCWPSRWTSCAPAWSTRNLKRGFSATGAVPRHRGSTG